MLIDWFIDAARFFRQFSPALRKAGFTVGWDSNGPEGISMLVDNWMAMFTYNYQPDSVDFTVALYKGVYAAGQQRIAVGMCPTCSLQNETVVENNFAELRRKDGPGIGVTKLQLFSFYGTGMQPPDGWKPFWPRMKAWLNED